jgi:PPOX class probable F420-dependent enzyme
MGVDRAGHDHDGVDETGPVLTAPRRAFIQQARRAVLVTSGSAGTLRPVPVCFALAPPPRDVLWTPLDEKPKQSEDPRRLARVRDILARPEVALLVDRWDEDWSRLGWLRLEGSARLLEPDEGRPAGGIDRVPDRARATDLAEHAEAVAALRARYPQYAAHALDQLPVIRVSVSRVVGWGPRTRWP